ncbi:hypothetical protein ACHRV6_06890 [Flavobacterium sp. FlaQc-51]|uniref:hypothetical protein n=1 Tax=Flavobacterium sp. FlaQc-51 TaxID=3374184 RepID=UPI003756B5A6
MNSDTHENNGQDDKNFQKADKGNQGQHKASSPAGHPITDNAEPDYGDDLSTDEIGNPYDSENLDNESDSESKDITEKEIEKDLIHNDPSEGFETDIDTSGSDEAESDTFKTIEPDQDNPVSREFEIGQLGSEEIREDECTRDETNGAAPGSYKPSQRKF